MEEIYKSYQNFKHLAHQALTNSNNGTNESQLNLANLYVQQWRNQVKSQVDFETLIAFDSLPKQAQAPLEWGHPFGIQTFSNFVYMEQQMNWLLQRNKNGNVTVNVNGNNNQVTTSGGSYTGNQSNISNSNDVNIQQGVNSTQNMYTNEDLKKFTKLIRSNLNQLNLSDLDNSKLNAQLDTIDSQLKYEPNQVIINEAGKTIRNLIEGTIGGLIAAGVQPQVWSFVESLLAYF